MPLAVSSPRLNAVTAALERIETQCATNEWSRGQLHENRTNVAHFNDNLLRIH
jgi:hypothetical protein